LKVSFQTERADWGFIVPSTLIWVSSLFLTAWDFVILQGTVYRFSLASALGLVLFSAGLSLRLISRRTLGKYYSYGLKPPEKLITHGIYKHIRHPCYFAMLLYTMGTPLVFSSLYGFVVTIGFVPFILYRIKIEEKMLIEKFGDTYREYMKKTKKLIPFTY
jgi:protein-S-isoprenylcysteine O-methyltransferase Ste14